MSKPDSRITFDLIPIGVIESSIMSRDDAPSQGEEGAPSAWIQLEKNLIDGIDGLVPGQEILVFTWFHLSSRNVLKLHPRWDPNNPITGVFNTRSPDRPNPIGLHPVTVLEIAGTRVKVGPLEAINGTPVIDIKPVI